MHFYYIKMANSNPLEKVLHSDVDDSASSALLSNPVDGQMTGNNIVSSTIASSTVSSNHSFDTSNDNQNAFRTSSSNNCGNSSPSAPTVNSMQNISGRATPISQMQNHDGIFQPPTSMKTANDGITNTGFITHHQSTGISPGLLLNSAGVGGAGNFAIEVEGMTPNRASGPNQVLMMTVANSNTNPSSVTPVSFNDANLIRMSAPSTMLNTLPGNIVSNSDIRMPAPSTMLNTFSGNIVSNSDIRMPALSTMLNTFSGNIVSNSDIRMPAPSTMQKTLPGNIVSNSDIRMPAPSTMQKTLPGNIVSNSDIRMPAPSTMQKTLPGNIVSNSGITIPHQVVQLLQQANNMSTQQMKSQQPIMAMIRSPGQPMMQQIQISNSQSSGLQRFANCRTLVPRMPLNPMQQQQQGQMQVGGQIPVGVQQRLPVRNKNNFVYIIYYNFAKFGDIKNIR